MGQLLPQTIKTLFGGVSKQPTAVRRENQVEESINAMPSIVSGGFEKRPATQFLSMLYTLENLLRYSEALTHATWVKSNMTVTQVTSKAVWEGSHPTASEMFLCDDTSSTAFGSVKQTITVSDTVTDEYIFSVDLKAATHSFCQIAITWEDTSFGSCTIDLGSGTILSHDGGVYITSGVTPLGEGWGRYYIWVSNDNGQTQPSCSVSVGTAVSSTGAILVSRAQIERVAYDTQIKPSPYAYTDSKTLNRTPVPGSDGEEYYVHPIDRDPSEQYVVLVSRGNIHVYDTLTGEAKQVITGDSKRYFAVNLPLTTQTYVETRLYYDPAEIEIDYTLAWNGVTTGAPNETVTIHHSVDGINWTLMHTRVMTTASGTETVTRSLVSGGGAKYQYVRILVDVTGATGNITVSGVYQDLCVLYEGNPQPEDFTACSIVDHTFIGNKLITVEKGPTGHPEGYSAKLGTYQNFSKLPTAAAGNLNKLAFIRGDDVDKFSGYWVYCQLDTNYYWTETVSPDISNVFHDVTLPFELNREPQGRFTFKAAEWTARLKGDAKSNPDPAFVGNKISNIFFYRGRLGVLTDESVLLSSSLDIYSWYAEKAVEVLDTDPIDRIAGTEKIAQLKYALPFRKILFLTSDTMQFELSSADVLTPKSAALDPSTAYTASPFCKPALMGDTLYFAAVRPSGSTVFEYYFDDDTLNNTATDITKHISNYIEGDIIQMHADPVSGTLYVLATGDSSSLWVYRAFWDDNSKVMSSWFKYTFDDGKAFIHGFALFSGYLVMIIETSDGLMLVQSTIETEPAHPGMLYTPLLDQRIELEGEYTEGNDTTTWYLPYEPKDTTAVVLGAGFAALGKTPGIVLNTTRGTGKVTIRGDYSGATCYIGNHYNMYVELSKIYMREQDGSTVLDGHLKLKDMQFSHQQTGYYRVSVTPFARNTYVYDYTGYTVGSGEVLLGDAPSQGGVFKVPVKSDAETVKIVITNPTQFPCIITTATWRGFFSEISRM